MKLVTNPATLQLAGLMLLIIGLLVITALLIRGMRKQMVAQVSLSESSPREESTKFATAAFQGVIAELKQREKALQTQLTAEAHRFAALDGLHKSMLESIGTGVLLFNSNLTVQQANPAARKLLGYASPLNMHVKDVFRGLETVELPSSNGALGGLGQALREVFTTGVDYRDIPAFLRTPSGDPRHVRLTLLPYRDATQQVIGAFCLLEHGAQGFTLSLQAQHAGKTESESE